MRKMIKTLLAVTLLSSTLHAADPSPQPSPVQADPALWVVKDADTTIYLFGTVHLLRPGITWFDGGVKAAYDASSEIVLEMAEPDPQMAQSLVMAKAIDPDGPALSAKLTPADSAAYAKVLAELGVPVAALEKMEPWFASTVLSMISIQKAGYSGDSGVEKEIATAAKKDGKKIGELESMEFQLGLFDTMPEPMQIAFLNATVAELPKSSEILDLMVASWVKGDPDALAELLNKSLMMTPELTKTLLTDRNANWADWIEKRLDQPGTIMIAVGAGHLAGANSVQEMLKAKKIAVLRIPS